MRNLRSPNRARGPARGRLLRSPPVAPDQIGTAIAAWYAADQIAGPPSDASAVATWADASGNSRDVTQATGANQPLYKTSIVNSKPVVRFDGTNDYLFSAAFGATLAQPNVILCVAKFNNVSPNQQILIDGNGATNRNILLMNAGVWKYWAASFVASATTVDTSWHVLAATYNGTSSNLRLDGTQIASGSPGANAIGGIYLGRWSDTNNSFFNGDLAEVVVYNAAISALQVNQVERYLGVKYGITVA